MTEPDEDTKEHPAYAEPAAPAAPDTAMPGAQQPPVFPGDPLQPTTTISTIPPTPPGTAPINPPAYPQPPSSGWPGQAAPQGYPPQPPGQWQQPGYGASPGYGQPGYGQPGYGAAPGWTPTAQQWPAAAPTYRTSVLVALAGLVLIIFGVAVAVLGAWTLTLGSDLGRFIRDNDIAIVGRQIDRETLRAVIQPIPGVLMVLGVLQLLVGAVVLAHRNWARWLGVLLALLGLIVSVIALSAVLALVPGMSVQLIVASVLLVSYAFVVLALTAGGGHFTTQHPRAR